MVRSGFRSTGEKGLGWFLIVSLVLHGAVLAFLLFHRKALSLGYMQATTVTLLSENELTHIPTPRPPAQQKTLKPETVRPKAPVAPRLPPKPVPRKAPPVVHKRPARLLKKRPPKIVRKFTKPVPRKAPVKPTKPSVKRRVSGSPSPLKHPPSSSKALPKNRPAAAAPSNAPVVPVKMDMEGQRFPTYLQHLLISRIKSNWRPPPGSHGLNVTLSFVLKKDGTLADDPILVTRSGSTVFDEAARFAILRSLPFPPFPPSYGKEQEVVTVTLQATKREGF